jgi:hypothetical protein
VAASTTWPFAPAAGVAERMQVDVSVDVGAARGFSLAPAVPAYLHAVCSRARNVPVSHSLARALY